MTIFKILLTFANGHTEIVTYEHDLGRYASLQAKQKAGAKSAKILSKTVTRI